MRLGIFGGTFDPPHRAHLQVAIAAQHHLALDQVWFVPARMNPLKSNPPTNSDEERLELLALLIAEHRSFLIDTRELCSPDPSFTLETLISIKHERPNDTLYFIMGSDSLLSFPRWKSPNDILALVEALVVYRREERFFVPEEIPSEKVIDLQLPPINISATAIRSALESGDLDTVQSSVIPSIYERLVSKKPIPSK